jgi:hypothetical protein
MHIVYIYLTNESADGLSNRWYPLTSNFHYSKNSGFWNSNCFLGNTLFKHDCLKRGMNTCRRTSYCGMRWRIWLRQCPGSTPYGVIGIFHWINPSDRNMALGSTQPLTEWVPVLSVGGGGGVKVASTCGWRPCYLRVSFVYTFWKSRLPTAIRASPGL